MNAVRLMLAVVLMLGLPKAFAGSAYEQNFATGPEGWITAEGSDAPLQWSSSGGVPGGRIYFGGAATPITASVVSTSFQYHTGAGLGLTFHITGVTSEFKMTLIGASESFVHSVAAVNAVGEWLGYYVALAGWNWHVGTADGPLATDEQLFFATSGGALRFDFPLPAGSPGVSLDNIGLIPEPTEALLLSFGVPLIVYLAVRRRTRVRSGH
jgi:hypothetical protein